MDKIKNKLIGILSELKKITWPSKKQILSNCWTVSIVCAIVLVITYVTDMLTSVAVSAIINLIG